ncbi:MAG: hypothetical protein IJ717_06315 [Treponema sp.]|nr:hypothetical protein [Treponema sp.]
MQKIRNLMVAAIFAAGSVFSFAYESSQSHQKTVSSMSSISLRNGEKSVFSAGDDGFIIKWNESDLGEHYQVSDLPVKMIAQNPKGNEVAVYETDGISFNRVSVWDWKNQRRKFFMNFEESVTSLSYSAKGTYVICGTVNGVYFIDEEGKATTNNINDNIGTFSFTMTSNSENNFVSYSPIGTLTYYDLKTGEKKYRFDVEPNLSDVRMFNKSIFLAGTKDGKIHIMHAVLKGKSLGSFNASKAVLLSSANDTPENTENLFYIINEPHQFKLFEIQNEDGKTVASPKLARTFSGLKTGERIVSGTISADSIYAGTNLGNIYKFDYEAAERVDVLLPITENRYDTVLDIAKVEKAGETDFYILAPSSVYKFMYKDGYIDKICHNSDFRNMISYGDEIILWTRDSRKPVVKINPNTKAQTTIFTPSGNIKTLKVSGQSLISVESNTSVNKYDIATGKKEVLYNGQSIQDAILCGNDLYVAKSSASSPNVPLLHINARTKETVPLSVKGTFAYSLNFDESSNKIYGIVIESDKEDKTSVFEFDLGTKASRTLIKTREEDIDAFMVLSGDNLYTNVGKTNARSFNTRTKRDFLYRRAESMPLKVVNNNGMIMVLNRNGSLSMYNEELNIVKLTLYLDLDGQWNEF